MLAELEIAINLGVAAIFGIICAVIAAGRGRSAVGWFFVGFFASCIGLILVLVLPDLKKEEEKQRRQSLETRRLQEQLAKERQIADQRHGLVERRLGAHDQALGLDTGAPDPLLTNAAAPPALPSSPTGAPWFYARGTERMGPVTAETIRHLLRAKAIDSETLVWRDGMPDWTAVVKTEEFRGDVA